MSYSFRFKRPERAGTLVKEKVRCGKAHCFCSKRERFHTGYALYWRDYPNGGKLRKKYVRKADVWEVQYLNGVAKLADKYRTATLQWKLIMASKALGEEYDYENDWRTWILRSKDFTLEQKWKVMHDIPLIEERPDPHEWRNWVGVPTYLENGNMSLTFYRKDELALYRRMLAGEEIKLV